MRDTISDRLEEMRTLLASVSNPRVACERKSRHAITLQYTSGNELDGESPVWGCDAVVECGSGNEHFCRFPPVSVTGADAALEKAIHECLEDLKEVLAERAGSTEDDED